MRTMKHLLVASAVLMLFSVSTAAEEIDCAKPLKSAQGAIDKVTDDLKGMERMPKDQLTAVHALIDDAQMFLEGARRECDPSGADYTRARAIAKAVAARGSAEAADILHWQFMKAAPAAKAAGTMPGMSMPGMKK
jgi:hypothetical protein